MHRRHLPMDDRNVGDCHSDADDDEIDTQADGGNDDVPLVPRSRAFLELSRDGDDDEDPSCFSDGWKAAASFLLTVLLLGPWMFSSYRSYRVSERDVGASTLLQVADSLECAATLTVSYSQLFQDIQQNRTGFCRDDGYCNCENPTIPMPREGAYHDVWRKAFDRNVNMAASAKSDLDMVFLGDSIIEHWLGTNLAIPNQRISNIVALWNSTWDGHAIPLAISADQCHHLLYRLQTGEMPSSLNPTAWWILIGTNDYGDAGCSKESTLVGILAVVLEVLRQKPLATRIILQGLLPRHLPRSAQNPTWLDFLWINKRLECLTKATSQLEFYNGTSLFLTNDKSQINVTLMPDFLHPSYEGYKVWSQDMIQKLRYWGIWSSDEL